MKKRIYSILSRLLAKPITAAALLTLVSFLKDLFGNVSG
jgi:hypothetical protein